jgi:hypothetical protein
LLVTSENTDLTYFNTLHMPKEPTVKKKRKNPAAVALSKLGASKGGIARAKKLSPEERSKIARMAVNARWRKRSKEASSTSK